MITVAQLEEVLNDASLNEREKTLKIENLNVMAYNHELHGEDSMGIDAEVASAALNAAEEELMAEPINSSMVCEIVERHLTKRELAFQFAMVLMDEEKEPESPIVEFIKSLGVPAENVHVIDGRTSNNTEKFPDPTAN